MEPMHHVLRAKGAPMASEPRITIIENGPYKVEGHVPLTQDAIVSTDGHYPMQYRQVCSYATEDRDGYLLCRCGHSKTMPFCDGTHARIGFAAEECASRAPFVERANRYTGPELVLYDDNRCAYARFCHRMDSEVWSLTEDATDETMRENAIAAAWECPTGRLVSCDRASGEAYEQSFEPSIVILEDVEERASGPLFVRGGIPLVGADGFEYEIQNRYALCRCGHSKDVPFCDAYHVTYRFYDGSPSFEGRIGAEDPSIEALPKPDELPPRTDRAPR